MEKGSSDPILTIKDLHISLNAYEGLAKIVDGINCTIRKGEVVAIVGESGCGKTLTAKAIMGILPPQIHVEGTICYKGTDLVALTEKERAKIRGREVAMIPQNPMTSLNPLLTIEEQLTDLISFKDMPEISIFSYYASKRRVERQKGAKDIASKVLEEVELTPPDRVLRSYPFQISGGMAQRVCIALALQGEPSLLIADEPGTSLDVTTQKHMLDLLVARISARHLTVIFITHNLAVARRIAQRIFVMYAGNIVEVSDADKIFVDPLHPYTQGLKKAVPTLLGTQMTGIDGRVPTYTDPPHGCRFHPRCPKVMEICKQTKPELTRIKDGRLVACHLYN